MKQFKSNSVAECMVIRDTISKIAGYPQPPREKNVRPGLGITTCQDDVQTNELGEYTLDVSEDLDLVADAARIGGKISNAERRLLVDTFTASKQLDAVVAEVAEVALEAKPLEAKE